VLPTASQLDFELNLKNYKSQIGFKGAEPWMYPKTKTFKDKAVIIDKGVFPAIPKIMQKKA
jgi:hypothetical protein